MKHLLNNMSEEEKNSIREQHTDKLKIDTTKFKSLLEGKLGDVKPFLNEQELDRELPKQVKGILGHDGRWFDEDDYSVNPDRFDYDEEIEFGPDDWEKFSSHLEKDFQIGRAHV